MLLNTDFRDISAYENVKVPFAVYCCRCDHIMHRGSPAKRIDATLYAHVSCPTMPLKKMSIEMRNAHKTRFLPNGNTLRYENVYVVRQERS